VKASTHRRLAALAEGAHEAFGGPVPVKDVAAAEKLLGVKFPRDYREFVSRYGGAQLGNLFVVGLRASARGVPDDLVTTQTERFRPQLPETLSKMVVIATDQGGNPIGFLPRKKAIFTHDYDFGGRHEVASDFEDFVLALLEHER
jgi:cell wall assembly regulator SMI1